MSTNIRCVVPAGDHCGEGVLWHPEEQAVYWTDINRFLVHRYSPDEDCCRSWFFNEPVTTILLTTRTDALAVVLGSGLIVWQPESDRRSVPLFQLPGWPSVRCNDAAVDEHGSIWIGTMRNNVNADGSEGVAGGTDGVLLRVDPDRSVTQWERGLGIANTVVWSADGRSFLLADSLANTISRYEWDAPERGAISGRTVFFHDFGRGSPDGSAMDEEGCLWNCRYGGGCLIRLSPHGELVETIEMPVENITNCTFGGSDRKTLYVTTARSPQRLSGSLFAIATSVAGLPNHRFAIEDLDRSFAL